MSQPFITYREPDSEGVMMYYILQKAFPHFLGCIAYGPIDRRIQTPVSNYNLWVTFAGTIQGNYVPSYRNVGEEIGDVMTKMATWFYENRILIEPKKYKKWKMTN
jgi:hypothetical protein